MHPPDVWSGTPSPSNPIRGMRSSPGQHAQVVTTHLLLARDVPAKSRPWLTGLKVPGLASSDRSSARTKSESETSPSLDVSSGLVMDRGTRAGVGLREPRLLIPSPRRWDIAPCVAEE